MRKKSSSSLCPIARSLEHVGEWWSMLIIRDALQGLTRFDEFRKSLSIAPNMLTRRLGGLVESGLLARHRYSERPPRDEYVLTESGRDFLPVIAALFAWGNRHFGKEGQCGLMLDRKTGKAADPILVDRHTGHRLTIANTSFALAPDAPEALRKHYEAVYKPAQ